ncbi:MAG TPA: cation:proton antiporter, partial [Ignisphaera sp.]|nr:cation:proton antiporter [Ignisphaera sp.]
MLSVKRLARSILPIVIAFVVYIVYTGSIRLYDIITGIAVSLIVGTLTATIVVEDWRKSLDIRRLALFTVYVFKYFLVHE